MSYYKRKLPHLQPPGAEYFLTTRLKWSLPKTAIQNLRKLRTELNDHCRGLDFFVQKKILDAYEDILDGEKSSPQWLGINKVAKVVSEAIEYRHTKDYDLYAYCIMPNHLHLVFRHLPKENEHPYPVTDIMRKLKRYTARNANKVLGRRGAFWQPESYDRVIRDQVERENTIRYVLNNPVKAGLVAYWEQWPFTYCKSEFRDSFRLK